MCSVLVLMSLTTPCRSASPRSLQRGLPHFWLLNSGRPWWRSIVSSITSSSARDIRSGLLYGGEWIHGSNGLNCSAGYAHAVSKTSGASYELTAGHCGAVGTSFVQGLGGTRTIGKVTGSGTYGSTYTTCDCDAVGGLSSSFTTNQVLTNGNAKYTYTHTGSPYAGEATCQTGASSYEQYGSIRCGYVTAINQTIQESGSPAGTFTLADCVQTNVHAQSGDSGAPFGDGTGFLGIQSASSGSSQSYFSKALNAGIINLNITY